MLQVTLDKLGQTIRAAALSAQGATDAQAMSMPSLYPVWAVGVPYGAEGQPCIVSHNGALYRCIQAHTSQGDWTPEVASLWTRIDVEHAGTMEDPIPAAVNMVYYEGKYYLEGETLYLCTRDSVDALQYPPSQLVEHYFEEVE